MSTAGNPAAGSLPSTTQVLIAGGGPVGLAAAVELGQRGISCVVIEPRRTVSKARPRCKTINVRSMEHLRRWGIADRLRATAPLSPSWSQEVVFCTTLSGYELSRFTGVFGLAAEGDRFPELGQQAPQFVLETLLREVVGELPPCRLALGARVTGLEQTEKEVRVAVSDAGGDSIVHADYALGCDGPRSAVREAIGSRYVGQAAMRPNFGVVFRAPELWAHVAHGRAVQYWIINPFAPGVMGPQDGKGIWWGGFLGVDRDRGEREIEKLITYAIGAQTPVEVLSTDPWTATMQLVDTARRGRVFLAGDAAHLNPPFGGHGLNTGLGDAVDLGWKLAAVLDGWGGPGLLDSYEVERRPIHAQVIAEAQANMTTLPSELADPNIAASGAAGDAARARADAKIQETKDREFRATDFVLGLGYASSPLTLAGQHAPFAETTRPGFRLPHTWISPSKSIYDALGPGMTLLASGDVANDRLEAFADACRIRKVPLRTVRLESDQLRYYGADLILIRPDQHVAWCGDEFPDPPQRLVDVARGVTPTKERSWTATAST